VKVALFDYGTGNLHSLAQAFQCEGAQIAIESDPVQALSADALVLPGVGAFGAAASRLASYAPALREALAAGHPCLGICLGMQLLFESSEEGEGAGLAVLPGRVRKLASKRVPHMGWNDVAIKRDDVFSGMDPFLAYFANSYIAEPAHADDIIAWTDYEQEHFASAVRRERTWGVQFHPEKSGKVGLKVIRNFLDAARP